VTVKENFTFLFVKVESIGVGVQVRKDSAVLLLYGRFNIGVGVQVRKDSAVLLLYGRFNSMELFEGPRS
jgi:hypothetical protein